MSILYITEHGEKFSVRDGCFVIDSKGGLRRTVPQETLESVMIMGNIEMTTQCVKECLKRGITVTFLSKYGDYFGRLVSTTHHNAERIKKQIYAADDIQFRLKFAQKIQKAKIHNQMVILKSTMQNQLKKLQDMRGLLQDIIFRHFQNWYGMSLNSKVEAEDLLKMHLIQ